MNLLEMFDEFDDDSKRESRRAPLNYTGTKRETLDEILTLLPYSNMWVDVFGGSGIVTIARKPSKLDIFNDRHAGIIAFYRAIQTRLDELLERIKLMPHGREFFEWCIKTLNQDTDDVVRGAKWYYLVQSSFAGRAQYWGRVTNGKNTIVTKIQKNLELFPTIHRRFQNVQIENLDWQVIFKDYAKPDAIIYCDPPYIDSNIYAHRMSRNDHKKLCDRIFDCDSFVALSGFDNTLYNDYPWDGKHAFQLQNKVSTVAVSTKDRLKTRVECLWIKEAG